MRAYFLGLAVVGLAACSPPPPNDGAQYFDNITPDPVLLEAEQARLAAVEASPETVLPPEDGGTVATAGVAKTAEEASTISDSQNFASVTQSETIDSDKAKLEALKANYLIVEPEAVPTREDGINLASYALTQTNAVGEKKYSRFGSGSANCNRYRNDLDEAQREFIRAGGPERDPRNLDSDGDGFACSWDPNVYRSMLNNG